MAKLHVMCGFSGSGKSTYVQGEIEDGAFPCAVIVEPDVVRKVLLGKEWHGPAENMVWSHVETMVRVLLLQNVDVFVDATCLRPQHRSQWLHMGLEEDVDVVCYVILTSFVECVRRNSKRERKVPIEVMERRKSHFIFPSLLEGFSEIRVINGQGELLFRVNENNKPELYHALVASVNPYETTTGELMDALAEWRNDNE
jgi:predicted kinase